jgi:hypothetical protein
MFTVTCAHADTMCSVEYEGDSYSPDVCADLVRRAADGLSQVFADLMQYGESQT